MNKLTSAVAALGLVLVASSPAFASRAGGPDTQNPIVTSGASVASSEAGAVTVWAGDHRETQPTVLADAVTGASSDPTEIVHVGRLTYRIQKAQPGDSETALAFNGRAVLING